MVEIRGDKKVLVTPVSAEDLKDIKIGDIVWLDGDLMTCRDVAHRRLVEEGRELPVDVRNNAIFHAGPIIRPLENDKFEMVSVGPTTSMRMEKFEYEFVKLSGVRVIIPLHMLQMQPETDSPVPCALVLQTESRRPLLPALPPAPDSLSSAIPHG